MLSTTVRSLNTWSAPPFADEFISNVERAIVAGPPQSNAITLAPEASALRSALSSQLVGVPLPTTRSGVLVSGYGGASHVSAVLLESGAASSGAKPIRPHPVTIRLATSA